MYVEIKELVLPSITDINVFPEDGFFKVTQTGMGSEDLAYVNKASNFWMLITPWAGITLGEKFIRHPELEEEEKVHTVTEDALLKTIAMLANKEKLSEL